MYHHTWVFLCMYYVHVCAHVCHHGCPCMCMQGTKVSVRCLPLLFSTLFFVSGALAEPGVQPFQLDLLASKPPRYPISTPPLLPGGYRHVPTISRFWGSVAD